MDGDWGLRKGEYGKWPRISKWGIIGWSVRLR